ncbi:hypothetical protein CEXT_736231 [Caerostris extrusa]|uniref:Uncharacterized protein n=1 Tax=Caerostris extrusa TaxID=172846 RepID=A0AAV4MNG2_CAEEX|nr:hypothetical protein CEXT_736231 [Caerostris extrusa]
MNNMKTPFPTTKEGQSLSLVYSSTRMIYGWVKESQWKVNGEEDPVYLGLCQPGIFVPVYLLIVARMDRTR